MTSFPHQQPMSYPVHSIGPQYAEALPRSVTPAPTNRAAFVDAMGERLQYHDYSGAHDASKLEMQRVGNLSFGRVCVAGLREAGEKAAGFDVAHASLKELWAVHGVSDQEAEAYAKIGVRAAAVNGTFLHLENVSTFAQLPGHEDVARRAAEHAWRCAVAGELTQVLQYIPAYQAIIAAGAQQPQPQAPLEIASQPLAYQFPPQAAELPAAPAGAEPTGERPFTSGPLASLSGHADSVVATLGGVDVAISLAPGEPAIPTSNAFLSAGPTLTSAPLSPGLQINFGMQVESRPTSATFMDGLTEQSFNERLFESRLMPGTPNLFDIPEIPASNFGAFRTFGRNEAPLSQPQTPMVSTPLFFQSEAPVPSIQAQSPRQTLRPKAPVLLAPPPRGSKAHRGRKRKASEVVAERLESAIAEVTSPQGKSRGRQISSSSVNDPSRPYVCDGRCGKSDCDNRAFRRQEHLKRHQKTLKDFFCRSGCNKGFPRSDNRDQHERSHVIAIALPVPENLSTL